VVPLLGSTGEIVPPSNINALKKRLQVSDGSTRGSYEGTIVLPADGRWTLQIPFHLSSSSTASALNPEVVVVTVNGNIDARLGKAAQTKTLTTAHVKAAKALTPGSRHALSFNVEGGSVTFKFAFTSAGSALSSHALVGNAVASCTSACTSGGHQPVPSLDLSTVFEAADWMPYCPIDTACEAALPAPTGNGQVGCTSSGDPHTRGFNGEYHHFQGRGEWTYAKNGFDGTPTTWDIRGCTYSCAGRVTCNCGVAVKFKDGNGLWTVVTAGRRSGYAIYVADTWVAGSDTSGPGWRRSGSCIFFEDYATKAQIKACGTRAVSISLPAGFAGKVNGICGAVGFPGQYRRCDKCVDGTASRARGYGNHYFNKLTKWGTSFAARDMSLFTVTGGQGCAPNRVVAADDAPSSASVRLAPGVLSTVNYHDNGDTSCDPEFKPYCSEGFEAAAYKICSAIPCARHDLTTISTGDKAIRDCMRDALATCALDLPRGYLEQPPCPVRNPGVLMFEVESVYGWPTAPSGRPMLNHSECDHQSHSVFAKVIRQGGAWGVATARVRTVAGTATAPADFTAVSTSAGTITFSANDTEPKFVEVPITCDINAEGVQTFSLTLQQDPGNVEDWEGASPTEAGARGAHQIDVEVSDEGCSTNFHDACSYSAMTAFVKLGCGSYIVHAGDTCAAVATRFNVSVDKISFAYQGQACTEGHGPPLNELWEYDVLTVKSQEFCDNLKCKKHVLQSGQSCAQVGALYGVPAMHTFRDIGTTAATPCPMTRQWSGDVLDVVEHDCIVDPRPPVPTDVTLDSTSTHTDAVTGAESVTLRWTPGEMSSTEYSHDGEQNGWRVWYCTNRLELNVKVGLSFETEALATETDGLETCTSIFSNDPNTISMHIPKPSSSSNAKSMYAAVALVRSGFESAYATAECDLTGCRRIDAAVCSSPSDFSSPPVVPVTVPNITCSSWGDPHVTMFQGFRHSFQGFGEYVLVKEQQQNHSHTPFEVQACHKQVIADFPATVNSAVGVNSRYGRVTLEDLGTVDGVARGVSIKVHGILRGIWNYQTDPNGGSGVYPILGAPGTGGGGSDGDASDESDGFGGDELSDYGDGFTTAVNATPTSSPTAPALADDPLADAFDPAENGGIDGHPGLFAPANGPLAAEDDDVFTTYYETEYGGGYYGEGGFALGRLLRAENSESADSTGQQKSHRRLTTDGVNSGTTADIGRAPNRKLSDASAVQTIRVRSTRNAVFVSFPGGERARFSYNGWGLDVHTSLPSPTYYDRVAGLCGTFGPDRDSAFAAQVEIPESSTPKDGETKCTLHPNSDRDRVHDWGMSWQVLNSVLALDNIDCDGRVTHDFCYTKASSASATGSCETKHPGFGAKVRQLCWGLSAAAYDACVLDAASTCSLSFGGQTVGAEAARSLQLRRNGNPGVVQFQGPASISVNENVRMIVLTVVRVYGTAGDLAVPLTLTPGRPGLASASPATLTCDPTVSHFLVCLLAS
jgi:hypothetical protein